MAETGSSTGRPAPQVPESLNSAVGELLDSGKSRDDVRASVAQAIAQWETKQSGEESPPASAEASQPQVQGSTEEAQATPEAS